MSMNNNFKGTPGPWKVAQSLDDTSIGVIPQDGVFAEDGLAPICIVTPVKQMNEFDLPNATLIAAAPEMLEAMQEFVDRVEKGEVRSVKTYAKFKSIIAKATTI